MIHERLPAVQPSGWPPDPGTPEACTDVQCCPTCGRPYFGTQASGLLDLLLVAHDSIARAKATLEAVVLP